MLDEHKCQLRLKGWTKVDPDSPCLNLQTCSTSNEEENTGIDAMKEQFSVKSFFFSVDSDYISFTKVWDNGWQSHAERMSIQKDKMGGATSKRSLEYYDAEKLKFDRNLAYGNCEEGY